jgi:hypothetical protein
MDVAHVTYITSVAEACCKHLFKIFHLLQIYVANVLIWMLLMFHTHVAIVYSKYFIFSVFCCSKCFYVASCKRSIWMLHIFTCMLRVYVIDVLSILDVCCIQVFHTVRRVRGSEEWWWHDTGCWGMERASRWLADVVRSTLRASGRGEFFIYLFWKTIFKINTVAFLLI